ncbi:eukaryotic translation initiation factor 3 subunit K [Phyllostomus discolor]|uniref:Eukaryotic translation initiation factor 3 subunit K n=1 Tax=Phyllostomus discolor TaxID=89673 RepID=A0A833YDA4_9CHIR|nr:eukaryotic translation initiation factor 3 subunit K [Phyllostomus discolor]
MTGMWGKRSSVSFFVNVLMLAFSILLMLTSSFLSQQALDENMDLLEGITGFEDSVRKFICHVVGITYQHIDRWLLAEMLGDLTDSQLKVWMSKYGWSADESGQIFICSQEESIKPKNIVEKIDFDSVSSIMASSQ